MKPGKIIRCLSDIMNVNLNDDSLNSPLQEEREVAEYLAEIIYIYKEESLSVCLSVCLFAMHSHTVQPISMKLSRNDLHTQGEVDIYLVRKKNEPYPCYRQSMKLTNRIAAFEKVTGRGSEGRVSAHTRHLTCSACPWQPGGCYGQPTKLTNRIPSYEKVKGNGNEGG